MLQIQEYIEKKKIIQNYILEYIETENDSDLTFQNIVDCIEDQKILEDKHETKALLLLISAILNNYHRNRLFFDKIERIFLKIKDDICQLFTNWEIFNIFKKNKRILLFLFNEKILIPDKEITNTMFKLEYQDKKYPYYFFNEIKPFVSKTNQNKIERYLIQNVDKQFLDPELFEKCRKEGENESFLCQLIREDSIENFVSYVTKTNPKLTMTIKPSIFESNYYLLKNEPSLIEYAAFFGSFQIFKYLQLNNVVLKPSLWPYVIHGQNFDLVHLLEEYGIRPEDERYEECLVESIKCHCVNLANYFHNYFVKEEIEEKMKNISLSLRYYNYSHIPDDLNNDVDFDYLCSYDYYKIVELLLTSPDIELNSNIISIKKIFFYKISKKKFF